MNEVNVNLNVPIDWSPIIEATAKQAQREVVKKAWQAIGEVSQYHIDLTWQRGGGGLIDPVRENIIYMTRQVIKEAIDEHMDEIIEQVVKETGRNLSRRKAVKSKVED